MTVPAVSAASTSPTVKRIAITLALLFCAGCALALVAPIEYMENVVRDRRRDRAGCDPEID
jgi:hypothetical protein